MCATTTGTVPLLLCRCPCSRWAVLAPSSSATWGGGSCEGNMIYIKKYIYLYIFFIYIKKKKRNVGLQKVCALVFRSQQ